MTNHAPVLTALADPTRRAIFERVARMPSAVGELAQQLPVSRPAVSQHLKVLKEAGIVRGTVDGPNRCYCLDFDALRSLSTLFADLERRACCP